MHASEYLTRSEKCALLIWAALRRDKHNAKTSSRLQKGNTLRGEKDFHLHRVYSEIPVEIMRNYVEAVSDSFPMTFAACSHVAQETAFEEKTFPRVTSSG